MGLRAGVDGQHLAAFVKATGRAHAMRHVRRVAFRTLVHLRQFEHAVVGPALALPACRWFTFWNAHKFYFIFSLSSLAHTSKPFFSKALGLRAAFFFNPAQSVLHNGCRGKSS